MEEKENEAAVEDEEGDTAEAKDFEAWRRSVGCRDALEALTSELVRSSESMSFSTIPNPVASVSFSLGVVFSCSTFDRFCETCWRIEPFLPLSDCSTGRVGSFSVISLVSFRFLSPPRVSVATRC